MSKDYFYFNRTDRIVALILLAVIIVTNIIRTPAPATPPQQESGMDSSTVVTEKPAARQEYNRRQYSRDTTRREYKTREYSRSTAKYSNGSRSKDNDSVKRDSVTVRRYTAKQRPESPVNLNAADSLELVKLPGIGPVTASRIIRYRNQLGGFVSTSQLSEINGLPDSLIEWFFLPDTVSVRRIKVNTESVSEMRRHPYMDFYQARAIVEFRKERGRLKGPELLSLLEEFTARDLERLLPYLDFR